MKYWQAVIREIDTPFQEQKTLEEKQLDDKQCIAACRALNLVTLLFSLLVSEIDPMMVDIDEEKAFGFKPLPNHTATQNTCKVSKEPKACFHDFSEADNFSEANDLSKEDLMDVDPDVEE